MSPSSAHTFKGIYIKISKDLTLLITNCSIVHNSQDKKSALNCLLMDEWIT